MLWSLTWSSLLNRRSTLLLTVLSLALSVLLLLSVEKVRVEARDSFFNTLSGTDLVVGARSGPVPLLLYSVFRIGDATNNITWKSYQKIAAQKSVKWTIPISLGDSHRGYRVIGTTTDYFKYYQYGRNQPLSFNQGSPFSGLFDVVIGAEVAEALNYKVGDKIVVAHGLGNVSFTKHDNMPFTVVGIINRTGTAVDKSVHVSLEAIEAIHVDWSQGVQIPGKSTTAEQAARMDLQPKEITAVLVGLKSKISVFKLQRSINKYQAEPLLAVLPGVVLQQLWQMVSVVEIALLTVSILVAFTSLIGMLTVLLSSLNERRRELAILRSVGAAPRHLLLLLATEAFIVTFASILLGLGLFYISQLFANPLVESLTGLHLQLTSPQDTQWLILGVILLLGTLIGLIPGYRAYRLSLVDGLTIRI